MLYFYSRPYARGDSVIDYYANKLTISTHAPTRGATDACHANTVAIGISTHAPTRGATFSPYRAYIRHLCISTHAPTRGATGLPVIRFRIEANFYSRPYARGDLSLRQLAEKYGVFLLTPLREGRLGKDTQIQIDALISTHAPTRGATRRRCEILDTSQPISTHAPTRGATHSARGIKIVRQNFYSRPYARGDLRLLFLLPCRNHISTHAPTRGATIVQRA